MEVTVNKRSGLVKKAVYDIRSVVDDCRSQVVGGLKAGLQIWESAVIPMLLNNADTWQEISHRTIHKLEQLQLSFLRCLLGVGTGCPKPLLYSETGVMLMEFRILEKKLMFLHHLSNLPETSLAAEILKVQRDLGLPGIAHDCREFLCKFGLRDLSRYLKSQFKRIVKSKICELNRNKIIEHTKSKNYKKVDIEKLVKDDFSLKKYFLNLNVSDARLRFKIASFMTPSVKMNFPSDNVFAKQLWACEGCTGDSDVGIRDTQHHILNCRAYVDFRKGKNFSSDTDLVDYFKLVLKKRSEV